MKTSHDDSLLVHRGRAPAGFGGLVNTPACRASTLLVDSYEAWQQARGQGNPYGHYARFGTPTTHSFCDMLSTLEGAHDTVVFPSGLASCTHTLMAFVSPGDHVLMADNVYGPTRNFATQMLTRMGVEVGFYSFSIGTDLSKLLRPNTRVVYMESPGSQTFELSDTRAMAAAARRHGAIVMMDNTWATPLFCKPLELGADVSIHAATKYIVGHSDAILGAACANERAWPALRDAAHAFGQTAGPDDLFLALRGLRSLSVRLRRHQDTALMLATRLMDHAAVQAVLHPALPHAAGHTYWKRDFTGSSGLFGVVLKPVSEPERALSALFSQLELFGMGLSWGGFESLALPVDPPQRKLDRWTFKGPLLRLHAGLEDPEELWTDLSSALTVYIHACETALS